MIEELIHQTEIRSDRIESLLKNLATNDTVMKMVRDVVDENKRLNSSVEEYGKMIMKIDDSVKQEVGEMVRRVQRVEQTTRDEI
jgi:hypothetical protein